LADFISNGRRFTGWAADDAYQQLSRNVDAIVGRVASMDCFGRRTQIVAVGHSLGAGLAEFSAFARKGRPRIAKVFSFNPSSEAASGLIDPAVLTRNVKGNREGRGLEIDIVYQPGEALEQVRESDRQFPLDQQCEPLVRTSSR
jgi:alpha-beta hydrolase superfamily lysophospholipase